MAVSDLEKSIKRLISDGAKEWDKKLKAKAVFFAPNHIKPYIVTKVGDVSNGASIVISVKKKEAFLRSSQYKRAYGGAVAANGGTMDAAAQEFGSGTRADDDANGSRQMITIEPRKRTGGNNARKYKALSKKHGIKALTYQRGWLAMPNMYGQMMERGAWQGSFRPSISKDGKTMFLRKVEHPGIFPYRGRGYIRPAIRSVMDEAGQGLPAKVQNIVSDSLKLNLKSGVLNRSGISVIIK